MKQSSVLKSDRQVPHCRDTLAALIKPHAATHKCVQQDTLVSCQALAQRGLQHVTEVREPFSFLLSPSSPSAQQGSHLLGDPKPSASESHTLFHSRTP